MRRVLSGINVIRDVLLKREPYFHASAAALDVVGQGKVEGFISGHAVTTVAYLLQKQLAHAKSRSILADLLSRLQVAPLTDASVRRALAYTLDDFEDAVTQAVAEEAGVSGIVNGCNLDTPPSARVASTESTFIAAAKGQLDNDPTCDEWTINAERKLVNVTNDG